MADDVGISGSSFLSGDHICDEKLYGIVCQLLKWLSQRHAADEDHRAEAAGEESVGQ